MHGSDLEVAIRKWQWSCMIVWEWPLQFSFHYFLFPFSPHFSQAHHPPLAQMRLFTLHPGSLYENHNFLDKVNYITANVNETGYGGVSQRTAVSWSQESFQLNFSPKKKPNQSSLCDDADIVAQLLFVPDKLDPNQTKLSEFRLSRISWRIPKSRLPGSLLSSATVQN